MVTFRSITRSACPFYSACLATNLQAAELAIRTGSPQAYLKFLTRQEKFSDALFEAEDAASWRILLSQRRAARNNAVSGNQDSSDLFSMTCLAQEIQQLLIVESMQDVQTMKTVCEPMRIQYDRMTHLAEQLGIPRGAPAARMSLDMMWHYCCMFRLAGVELLSQFCDNVWSPTDRHALETFNHSLMLPFLMIPKGRLAVLHACALLQAARMADDLVLLAYP